MPAYFTDRRATIASGIGQLSVEAKLEIERMFISSYFSNKHYIHPVLCKKTFMRRCEQETWNMHRRTWPSLGQSKFAGLYFAVVALGAINATPNETSLLEHYCTYSGRGATGGYSTLDFADFYFGVTKQALGDIFESSSIESTQALLLMVGAIRQCSISLNLTSASSVHSVKMPCGLIAALCTAAWPLEQQWPLGSHRECRRCQYTCERRENGLGGMYPAGN